MPELIKVYCIVVTYNGVKWLDKCFGSLRDLDFPIKTIAVDNGSTDGTVESLKSGFPEVEIICPERNLGFGMGNTLGVKKAMEYGADFVFLFNQDAYFLKGSFANLIKAFENEPGAGIISPIHLAGDEENLDFGFYKYAHPEDTPHLLGDIFNQGLKVLYQSKFINAAAWIMKTSMIKDIGFFHPIFDHYGEDREYASRMEKAGYKIFVFPACSMVHDRPQNRLSNEYYKYGKNLQRKMLQALVEKELTYQQVTFRYFKHLIANVLSLKIKDAVLIYKSWRSLNKRMTFLSSSIFPDKQN